ncbi:MAG: hypothetical protein ACLRZ2_04065 [Veillonella sp.]
MACIWPLTTMNGASKFTAPEIMTTIIIFTVIYLACIAALYLAVEHIKKGLMGKQFTM